MLLSEIIPKYIVLNESYDDFAKDTEQIDYKTEDFVSQVIDITSVLYTNSLESIWGFLGFVWDEYNVKGHFETISMPFSVIPRIPDAYRIKEFPDNMFNAIASVDIEMLDSNFENVTKVGYIANNNKHFILHWESINLDAFNFNSESYNGATGRPSQEIIDKYGFGSIELYNKYYSKIQYSIFWSTFQGITSKIVITDENKDYCLIDKTGVTDMGVWVKNAIYYKEDKPLIVYDLIHNEEVNFTQYGMVYLSKQNKFTICCSNLNSYYYYQSGFIINDENAEIKSAKFPNYIDLTVEFKLINKPIDIGDKHNMVVINTMESQPIRSMTYDWSNFNNLIAKWEKVYIQSLSGGSLWVIPELNNIDEFINTDFDTVFKHITDGTISCMNTYAGNQVFFENIPYVDFSNQYINIPEGKYKTINFNHCNILLNMQFLICVDNKSTTRFDIPFKFINTENMYFIILQRNEKYTINEDGTIDTNTIINNTILDYPLKCKGIWSSLELRSRTDDYHIECTNIVCIWNAGPHINLTNYTFDTIPNNLKPCVKLTIEKEKRRNDDIFISNNILQYDSNFLGIHTDEDVHNKLNELYPDGVQLLELDNKINYQFTTNDDFKFCNFITNTGGANINKFKTANLRIKGPNYLIYNKAGENITNAINTNKYIIMYKMLQYNMFYNANIYVLTIQDDIHAFIDAFVDEELPEDRVGKVDIQIVHENFIQLSDDEKSKLISLGYNVIDTII